MHTVRILNTSNMILFKEVLVESVVVYELVL